MKTWLVDTGPWVAYLDRRDDHHERVASVLEPFTGSLVTTGAVITEAMHFLSGVRDGPAMLAELVDASRAAVYDLCQPSELRLCADLMAKYADAPMDFADATLVLLAEALDVREILTLDRRGFRVFRTGRRRGFRMVLDV